MNTPTPLGKTYEQYKKELKEFKEINLSKVEKIEFNESKKAENLTKILGKGIESVEDWVGKLFEAQKNTERELNELIKQFEIAKGLGDRLEKQAKELGVKVTDVPALNKLMKEVKFTESAIKKAKKVIK